MKSVIVGMLACGGAIFGSTSPSVAQNALPVRQKVEVRRTEETADPSHTFRAKDVLGMTIRNAENEEVGTVEDLVIDSRNGQVLYAVMAHASLQNRDQLIITPWRALQVHSGPRAPDRFVMLQIEPQRLLKGPIVTRNQWPQVVYSEWPTWQTRIDSYYQDVGDVRTKTQIKEKNGKFEQKTETRTNGVKAKEEIEVERKRNGKEEIEIERKGDGVKEKAKIEVEKDGDVEIKKKVERKD